MGQAPASKSHMYTVGGGTYSAGRTVNPSATTAMGGKNTANSLEQYGNH
jgi:hypothetical protein